MTCRSTRYREVPCMTHSANEPSSQPPPIPTRRYAICAGGASVAVRLATAWTCSSDADESPDDGRTSRGRPRLSRCVVLGMDAALWREQSGVPTHSSINAEDTIMDGLALVKNPRALLAILKETYGDWSEDKASRLAAALAYYTAFSVAPLLLISIAVAGLVFGREAAQGQIFAQLDGMLGSDGASAIQTGIANSNKAGAGILSTIIGLATLIWSASSLFGQLQESLNTIWEVQPDPHAGI